jgi:hypothetical protein
MWIRFAKSKKNHAVTLNCLRDNGSCTWQASSDYFARHDLIHYAVETTLGYTQAFLGLVAQGKDLDQFGTKNGVRDVYTTEEAWAEGLVGLLQWPAVTGGPALNDDDFFAMLVKSCEDNGCPVPRITSEQVAHIREKVRVLHQQWDKLPAGETLELLF